MSPNFRVINANQTLPHIYRRFCFCTKVTLIYFLDGCILPAEYVSCPTMVQAVDFGVCDGYFKVTVVANDRELYRGISNGNNDCHIRWNDGQGSWVLTNIKSPTTTSPVFHLNTGLRGCPQQGETWLTASNDESTGKVVGKLLSKD